MANITPQELREAMDKVLDMPEDEFIAFAKEHGVDEWDTLAAEHKVWEEGLKMRPDFVKPDSMWLVVYECRYDVIRVSPRGDGFFAPGQEPLWAFSNINEWIQEITIPENQ